MTVGLYVWCGEGEFSTTDLVRYTTSFNGLKSMLIQFGTDKKVAFTRIRKVSTSSSSAIPANETSHKDLGIWINWSPQQTANTSTSKQSEKNTSAPFMWHTEFNTCRSYLWTCQSPITSISHQSTVLQRIHMYIPGNMLDGIWKLCLFKIIFNSATAELLL